MTKMLQSYKLELMLLAPMDAITFCNELLGCTRTLT